MQRLVGESLLPRLDLDISDNDIPGAVEKIADWLEGDWRAVDEGLRRERGKENVWYSFRGTTEERLGEEKDE
jgi:hypothetical protein